MKIIHIMHQFGIGGVENMMRDIINIQINHHNIDLIIIDNIIDEYLINSIDKRVNVIKLKKNIHSRNLIYYIILNILLYLKKPDIIHLHQSKIIDKLFFQKAKIFATVHNIGWKYKKSWNKYHRVFAISKAVMEDVFQQGYKNVILAENGINKKLIKKRPALIFDKCFKIICVSRLNHLQKGQDVLIKAIYNLVNGYKIDYIHLDLIGEGTSKDFLVSEVEKMDLNNFVSFLGEKNRDYIYNNLYKYDLMIQPSNFEGFGITVIESFAANLPILVSNIDGPNEIIEFGNLGSNFIVGDDFDLSAQIKYIILNYQLSLDKAIMAYNKLDNSYTIENTAKIYLNNYI